MSYSAPDAKDLILAIIEENYSDPILSVQYLAEKMRMSVSYLREIICDNFGMCPQKLIEEYRLNMALNLIVSDMEIAIIAHKVGYGSVRAFRRSFKKRFGVAPFVYSKNCKSNHVIFNNNV